jgi:hypothetical protein
VSCYVTADNAPPRDGVDPTALTAVEQPTARQSSFPLTGSVKLTSARSVQVVCANASRHGSAAFWQACLRATTANQIIVTQANGGA